MITYNKDINLLPLQDISNVFSSAYLFDQSSSNSAKYKREWYKSRVIRTYILSAG